MTKEALLTTPLPNGTLVTVSSAYPCKGQVCGNHENFMGLFYEVVILESALFPKGEIMRIAEVYVTASPSGPKS